MFKKLMLVSIISVNMGYTLFLFPLLGVLYPKRIPFTINNLLAFTFVDTFWGILFATLIHTISYVIKKVKINTSIVRVTSLSIITLWIISWSISILSVSDPSKMTMDDIIIIGADGVAAIITGITFLALAKRININITK